LSGTHSHVPTGTEVECWGQSSHRTRFLRGHTHGIPWLRQPGGDRESERRLPPPPRLRGEAASMGQAREQSPKQRSVFGRWSGRRMVGGWWWGRRRGPGGQTPPGVQRSGGLWPPGGGPSLRCPFHPSRSPPPPGTALRRPGLCRRKPRPPPPSARGDAEMGGWGEEASTVDGGFISGRKPQLAGCLSKWAHPWMQRQDLCVWV